MNYISTRNNQIRATGSEAIVKGLADDGGLFVPCEIPKLQLSKEELLNYSYDELASVVINALLPEFSKEKLLEIIKQGYGDKFDTEERTEIKYAGGFAFTELYHGPTSAFKDMALCLLPGLLSESVKLSGSTDKIMILTATSGDTGKAALEAFSGSKDCEITVFYPVDGVSDIQKLQMQTQAGDNVHVCSIKGNFDNAQTGVKEAFDKVHTKGVTLGSANSINIGRLVPQVVYYFRTYGKMVKDGKLKFGDSLNFAVPTGNFGDIFAGWIAKQMGLPVGRLLCASNANNVLTDFIHTGKYDRRREFYQTASPSMDILVSSNLERLLHFACGKDCKLVKELLTSLSEKGFYEVDNRVLGFIQKDFDAAFADDDQCFKSIKELWEKDGYLMDTHTAVAYSCIKDKSDEPWAILSTASPYKFSASVLSALGETVPGDCFEAMEKLHEKTHISIPQRLADLKTKDIIHKDCINPDDLHSYVKNITETL